MSLTEPVSGFSGARFLPYVNTEFRAQLANGETAILRLIEVADTRRAANERQGVTGECYSLMFVPANGKQLAQDCYRLKHPALGSVELFLAPVERDEIHYEAVLNHQRPA